MLYLKTIDGYIPWRGEPIKRLEGDKEVPYKHPLNIEEVWTDEELAAWKLYREPAWPTIPEGKQLKSITGPVETKDGIGWEVELMDIPPPDPKDFPLTARQLRQGMRIGGIAMSTVQAAIDAIPNPSIKEQVQIDWEYAAIINWEDTTTQMLMEAVGVSQEQARVLWLQAKDLDP